MTIKELIQQNLKYGDIKEVARRSGRKYVTVQKQFSGKVQIDPKVLEIAMQLWRERKQEQDRLRKQLEELHVE